MNTNTSSNTVPVVVKGPPEVPFPRFTEVRPRLEIDVFVKDSDVLNIYLQALAQLQVNEINGNKPWRDDPYSYFQMAAIHGFKLPKWDIPPEQLKGLESLPWFDNRGFCTHSSVLFPSWHRVYLTLFEQKIVEAAKAIANSYKNPDLKQRYLSAASRLRLPYWDPMVVRGKLDERPQWFIPYILGMPYVWLRLPGDGKEDKLTKRPNPLYSYVFPRMSEVKDVVRDIPSSAQGFTVRCPEWHITAPRGEQNDTRMRSNHARLNEQILLGQANKSASIKVDIASKFEHVAKFLINDSVTWNEFSNTNWQDNVDSRLSVQAGPTGSIEGWHDDIHGLVGWNYNMSDVNVTNASGSMADVPSSSFDPIFWLHHTNCDRLMALYQMTHPNQWIAELHPGELKPVEQPTESPWAKRAEIPTAPLGSPPDVLDKAQKQGLRPTTGPYIREFSTTPLLPFRKTTDPSVPPPKAWWNSDDVRDWTPLGYSYEGIRYCPPGPINDERLQAINDGKKLAYHKYGWMTVENYLNSKSKNGVFPKFLIESEYEVFDLPLQYDNDQRRMPELEQESQPQPQPLLIASPPLSSVPSGSRPPASKPPVPGNSNSVPPPPPTPPPAPKTPVKPTTGPSLSDALKQPKLINTGDMEKLNKKDKSQPQVVEDKILYKDYEGDQVLAELGTKLTAPEAASQPANNKEANFFSASTALDFGFKAGNDKVVKHIATVAEFYEWDVIMKVNKFAAHGPFTVYFFLGDYNKADPSTWTNSANMFSINYVLANSHFIDCANCVIQDNAQVQYMDSVCLTPRLLQVIGRGDKDLTSLDPKVAGPYISANLWIEVIDQHNNVVTRSSDMSSLEIEIMNRLVQWDKEGTPKRGASMSDRLVEAVYPPK